MSIRNTSKRGTLTKKLKALRRPVRPRSTSSAIRAKELERKLDEALAHQSAISEVLRVIASSPGNLAAVFETVLTNVLRLCDARFGVTFIYENGKLRPVAERSLPRAMAEFLFQRGSFAARPGSIIEEIVHTHKILHVHDILAHVDSNSPASRLGKARTQLTVPIVRENRLLGVIGVFRQVVRPFTEQQIRLVDIFAHQAAIAIENTRLFDEVQAKTHDLEEMLQQQTATADVLKVISRSAFDLNSVLTTLLDSALNLVGAQRGAIFQRFESYFCPTALRGYSPELLDYAQSTPIPVGDGYVGQVATSGRIVHIPDTLADQGEQKLRNYRNRLNIRSWLGVPIVRDGQVEGVFALVRGKPEAFTPRQIELVEAFADQAVVAINNTRLFNETKEALERQTATAEILKVIASSPTDLQPVFDAIAERSNQLMGGHSTAVYRFNGETVHLTAFTSVNAEADAALQAMFPKAISAVPHFERVSRGETVEYSDILSAPTDLENAKSIARSRGFRGLLLVPLTGEKGHIGLISVTRKEPGQFQQHHVDLLKTFANQAVIAIANVNLFNEVQQRTQELSQSLDDLRSAQDRLVQTEKLASLGQLTAGIAHEIKNPLNFVNNFSSLSAELIDEMTEALDGIGADQKKRAELNELAKTLKSNLEKIIQHGRRADSIVKNMLLHSREGSGEQRPVDINALVDEGLNLAYHGARAEKPDFNITLQRNLDPDAGQAEIFPQDVTRVLLNIFSNGFYAATRRARDASSGFVPTICAETRNLGDRVEVRIRDNGTGMPAEVKAKIFTPFFTTKPPGEGTGLGLSMSHDIIVKQHGGSIHVESEPGFFTEFVITLPRRGATRRLEAKDEHLHSRG